MDPLLVIFAVVVATVFITLTIITCGGATKKTSAQVEAPKYVRQKTTIMTGTMVEPGKTSTFKTVEELNLGIKSSRILPSIQMQSMKSAKEASAKEKSRKSLVGPSPEWEKKKLTVKRGDPGLTAPIKRLVA